jgi:hypothetical protein
MQKMQQIIAEKGEGKKDKDENIGIKKHGKKSPLRKI